MPPGARQTMDSSDMSGSCRDSKWIQPRPGDPSPFLIHIEALRQQRKEEGTEGSLDSMALMNSWQALTFDERKDLERGLRQDRYRTAITKFNANIPLSPSVSGESSSDSEPGEGTVKDRRAIQRWNRYRRDYRGKAGRYAGPSPMPCFPFLRLPFDIRRMVYVLLVKRTRRVVQMESNGSGKHQNGPIDLRLAFTNKELFAEVFKAFFEENVIQLDISPGPGIGLPILFDPNAKSAEFWPFEGIKRVYIFLSYYQSEHKNFVRAELTKLVNVLRKCSFVLLQITAFCNDEVSHEGLDESFDQAIACLESLRGAQELVFTKDLNTCLEQGLIKYSCRHVGTEEYKERLQEMATRPRDGTSNNTD